MTNIIEQADVKYIDIDLIKVRKLSSRNEIDIVKLKELEDSIKRVGLFNSITVRKEKKFYYVIAGRRRLQACKNLKLKHVLCNELKCDDAEALIIELEENLNREDISIVEESDFLAKVMRKLSISQRELAVMMNKSESYVSERIAITKYMPALLRALKANKISFSVAREFAKIDNKTDLERYLEFARSGGVNPRIARHWMKQWKLDRSYIPTDEILDGSEVAAELEKTSEMMTSCHICNIKFAMKDCIHMNLCKSCSDVIRDNMSD